MDSNDLNKAGAALLVALLAAGGAALLGDVLVPPAAPIPPAFTIGAPAGSGTAPSAAATPSGGIAPIADRLAHADASRGHAVAAALCSACHSLEKNGETMVGPPLWNAFGRPIAEVADYVFSPALKAHHGRWTAEALDSWLLRPQDFAPGTRMGFAGIPDAAKRADVVAFLETLSDAGKDDGAHATAAGPATAAASAPGSSPASAALPTGRPVPGPAVQGASGHTSADARPPVAPAGPQGPGSPPSDAKPSSATSDAAFAALVDGADPNHGEALAAASCGMCHSFDKDGPDMMGPALHDAFDAPVAARSGYAYSPALRSHGGRWTIEALDGWLRDPRATVPGTRMMFPGLPSAPDRAAVIAFLRSLRAPPR
ncbi:c-type cytochrome [Rhizosaccharibacter radicis]|uniref:C-type cytochrome n=1 Tax=Rhizosaccharibacter radicis TaxID=2782605 RepID=A0ABT1VXU4_9PROT|nr:c-type cytochrome [Acetobacteraceae bacterium KSS12]